MAGDLDLFCHARCWRTLALLSKSFGKPPSALQGHRDGQQQAVMQLPLLRRERMRLQAQQHGAGCRLVAFRHVEQTGGSSVREWMLRLERMGQARFYGQTTRCAPPLAGRYAPAQTDCTIISASMHVLVSQGALQRALQWLAEVL